jgi:hypothetical protein
MFDKGVMWMLTEQDPTTHKWHLTFGKGLTKDGVHGQYETQAEAVKAMENILSASPVPISEAERMGVIIVGRRPTADELY